MEKQFSVSARSVKIKFLSLVENSYQFSLKSLRLILAFGAFLLVPAPAFPETIITESDYTLIVNDSKRVVQLLLPTTEFNFLAQPGYPSTSDIRNLTTRIYSHFNDQFDFLIFISNQDTTPAGKYSGLYFEVKNDVTGIGVRLFDDAGYYGSLGQLQGIIHLTSKNGLKAGPSLHEIAHRWGNYLIKPTDHTYHWGLSSVGGQLGGWLYGSVKSLGGNLYQAKSPYASLAFGAIANYGNNVPYSELELYLMGLISTNEVVTPIQIAINGVHTNPTYGQFTADGFETNTIAQIVARQGARVPSVAAAQKTFRAMLVVLTTSALPASRLAQYDSDVGNFSLAGSDGLSTLNFWEATGGRAQLQMNELVPKPAVAPRLNALKQGTNLTLTWPENSTGFILESTTALPSGLLWNPVTEAPERLDGQNVLSLPIFPGTRFYRLQK